MLAGEIKSFFKGEVVTDERVLAEFSRDASIFEVRPQVVVFPRDSGDLKNLVKFVRARKESGENISLTGRAGGTDMGGGPLTESIVVSFTKYFNHIKQVAADYAVVEPGVFYRDLEKEMDKLRAMLPSYPGSKSICAIGGIVSNNSGGEKSLVYGKTEKYVKRLNVVLSDGNEYILEPLTEEQLNQKLSQNNFEGEFYKKTYQLIKNNHEDIQAAKPNVSKNSAGYYLWNVWDGRTFDLTKLFVGSQGTLGLITEVELKLLPKSKFSRLAVIFLKDLDPLTAIIETALPFKPESLEVYDDQTLKLAFKFLPDIIKSLKGNIFSLLINFIPDFWLILTKGFPKLVVLAELTGNDEQELLTRIKKLGEALEKYPVNVHLTKGAAEAEKYFTIRRESFNLLRRRVKGKHTAPFIDDIIVQPNQLKEFLPKLNALLEPNQDLMTYTIAGHAGDGNFHIIPLLDLSDPATHQLIPKLTAEVYDLVLKFGGSITAEHNDGLIRSPYLKQMYGEKIYGLFEEVKKIFDPLNIFNPGKKVGADLQYSLYHISNENL